MTTRSPRQHRTRHKTLQPSSERLEYEVGLVTLVYFTLFIFAALNFYGGGLYHSFNNYIQLFSFYAPMALIGMFGSLFVLNAFVLKPSQPRIEVLASVCLILGFLGFIFWISVRPVYSQDFLLAEFTNTALLAPFCEEIFYRLFLLNFLFRITNIRFLSTRKNLRWSAAIVISSLIFMAGHFEVYATKPLLTLVIGIFIPSVCWSIFFVWYKTLSLPVAIHSALNMILFTWYYLLT